MIIFIKQGEKKMYCAHCGAEIMTFLDEEWEYCPKCERYTHVAVQKTPKALLNNKSKEYVMMQVLINILIAFLMSSTGMIRFCTKDESAGLGVFCLFFISILMMGCVVVEESRRGWESLHTVECVIFEISFNIFNIFAVVTFIKDFLGLGV